MIMHTKSVTVYVTKLENNRVGTAVTLAPRLFPIFCATCNETTKWVLTRMQFL
jgi:hypothetical protein